MFNLEQAIADWRQKMLAAGIENPVPLEELELHLREEMKSQVRAGIEAEQAFKVAVQRIGEARSLETEFNKIPKKPFGILGIILLGGIGCGNIAHGWLQLMDTDFSFAFIGGSFTMENFMIGPGTNLLMGLGSLYVGGWLIWKATESAKMRTIK